MTILFHSTHRKFIQFLRTYADRGTYINVTDIDKERYSELIQTSKALERHKSIYKLTLEILNRNTPREEGYPFTHEMVNAIAKHFACAERRKPWSAFLGTVVIPFLRLLQRKS